MTNTRTRQVGAAELAAMFPALASRYSTMSARTLQDIRRAPLRGLGVVEEASAANKFVKQLSAGLCWAALGIGGIAVLTTGYMAYRAFSKPKA